LKSHHARIRSPGGWLDNPEVLPDADVIPDAPGVEPSCPFLSYELPEIPVGAVQAKLKSGLDRKQRENHADDDVKVKDILGKEPLEPTQTGVPVNGCRHGVSQFVEADGLHHTEGMEYNFDMTDVLLFIVSDL